MKHLAWLFLILLISLSSVGQVPAAEESSSANQHSAPASAAPPNPELHCCGLSTLPPVLVLRAGSEVKLQFAQSLSSKHAATGERIELRVAEDVNVGDANVIPKGARVIGTVTRGKKNEKYGNTDQLVVRVDYIVVGDKRIKITGEQKQKAKTATGPATASTIALGLTGLMIYMSNREAWIREGTSITGYTAEDVTFPEKANTAEVKAE